MTCQGFVPLDQLIKLQSGAWAALDVIERNVERELAITGRTLQYLASGVPVIYNDYSTLSDDIREYKAGWTIATDTTTALQSVFDELVEGGPRLVDELSKNALRLTADRFDPRRSMQPLVELCNSAGKRMSLRAPRQRKPRGGTAPVGRVLGITPDSGALSELRMNNPLRALHRQQLIDGFATCGALGDQLASDNSLYEVIFIQRAIPETVLYRPGKSRASIFAGCRRQSAGPRPL